MSSWDVRKTLRVHLVHFLVLVDGLVWQAEVELHRGGGLGCGETPANGEDRSEAGQIHTTYVQQYYILRSTSVYRIGMVCAKPWTYKQHKYSAARRGT